MLPWWRASEPTLIERQALDMAKGIEPDYRYLFPFRHCDLDLQNAAFPRQPMTRVLNWLGTHPVGLWKYVYVRPLDPKENPDLWGVAFTTGEDATGYSSFFDVAVVHPSIAMADCTPRFLTDEEAEPYRAVLAAQPGRRAELPFVSLPPAVARLRSGDMAAQRLRGLPHLGAHRVTGPGTQTSV